MSQKRAQKEHFEPRNDKNDKGYTFEDGRESMKMALGI